MSILDPAPALTPDVPTRIANQLKQNARSTFRNLVETYTNGAKLFWQNPAATPEEIAAALGTDGVELFQLHAKIGALLGELKPETVAGALTLVGEFTYNEDGSLNISAAPPEQ